MTSAEPRIHIIGVGSDGWAGLSGRARELLHQAGLVLGADPVLGLLPEVPVARRRTTPALPELLHLLESQTGPGPIVLVASGDPLFYGVSRYLAEKLGKDRFDVLPHVSSMQLAFARVKESWEDAYLTDLSAHPLDTVLDRVRVAETVGLFTSPEATPRQVARSLLVRGIDYFRAYVCENLGGPDERVTQGELADIAQTEFDPLNVMILVRKPGHPDQPRPRAGLRRFGNPDDCFAQSGPKSGLITQAETRAVALAELDVQPGNVVWDIGAGSGSVAIEAAQLAQPGMVYAIEQDAVEYHLIVANAERFGVKNLKAVHGSAPAVFDGLPAPDAVFVGGTGRETGRMLQAAFAALRPAGRLTVNVATLESLGVVYPTMKELTRPVHVKLVQVSRGTEQFETLRLEALNPSFLLSVTKPEPGP